MKRWLVALVPLLLLGTLIAWRFNAKKSEAAAQTLQREARKKAVPVVSAAPAAVRDVVQTFEAIGSVEAPYNVNIAPETTGQIVFLQAREGDPIKAGQVLARIDPAQVASLVRQQEAALAEAQFRLAQARINQDPTNASVGAQLRQQEAAVASAEAEHNQAKANYASLIAGSAANIADMQGRITNATAAIATAKADVRSAQANLENARASYKRVQELFKQGFVAEQEVDDKRTAVDVRAAEVEAAQERVNSAIAARDSAQFAKRAAEEQARIGKNKGDTDIATAAAKLRQAQAALDSARANMAQKPAYQQTLAALESSVNAAKAALRSAQSRFNDTILKAPFDGVVTQRLLDVGAIATVGQPILSVQTVRQVWVTIPVPEEISRHVTLGLPANVFFDALPGQTFQGKVTQVNPSADPLSRQFTVRVTLDNPRHSVKPGMFARIKMVTERATAALVVPREAVQHGPGGEAVFVVGADNKAQRRTVTTGASDATGIVLTQGVKAGERVVTMSALPIKDGQTIKVADAPSEPNPTP